MKTKIFALLFMQALILTLIACQSSGELTEETTEHVIIYAPSETDLPAKSEETTDMNTEAVKPIEPVKPIDEVLERAEALCAELSLEVKIGQLILAHVGASDKTAIANAKKYHPGGYLFFAANVADRTPDGLREFISQLNEASELPLFTAVDEEGGTVVRVSKYPQFRAAPFKSPRALISAGGLELVKSDTLEKCNLLASLGLNLNLAPVADISESKSEFIYQRSAGNADTASDYVRTYIEASAHSGVGACLKHFPGYGGNADTHTGAAVDTREYEVFESRDFLPFTAGIEAGAGAIMVSHNTVNCMDTEAPASLSPEVHRILREELGFDGVIITDDLAMNAVTVFAKSSGCDAAVLAIEAGNDLICASDLAGVYDSLYKAVESGRLTEERIDESVVRILYYKLKLGIIAE